MKYMGSKNRHAKELLPIILEGRKPEQWYVEPFVGGANMIDKVDSPRLGADIQGEMIALYRALQLGWEPPTSVSEEFYSEVKGNQAAYPTELVAYLGYQLSYGAVWFSTFRRDSGGKRDYADEAYRHVMRQAPKLTSAVFTCSTYDQLEIPPESVIYCDPPYAGTTGYKDGAFDHAKFWQWCDAKVAEGHTVFVSEYTAPRGWECVWSKEVNNTLTKDTGSKKGIERLFRKRTD